MTYDIKSHHKIGSLNFLIRYCNKISNISISINTFIFFCALIQTSTCTIYGTQSKITLYQNKKECFNINIKQKNIFTLFRIKILHYPIKILWKKINRIFNHETIFNKIFIFLRIFISYLSLVCNIYTYIEYPS